MTGGLDAVDVVAVVPSTHYRHGEHPLAATLRSVSSLGDRVVDALAVGAAAVTRNGPSPDAYMARKDLVGSRRVLLVDDTYTTGAHLHSAAGALLSAGASTVLPLVVGRRQNEQWPPSRRLLEWAAQPEHRWSADRCVRCWSEARPAGTAGA